MGLLATSLDALGDLDGRRHEPIRAGTLRTTRATGLVAVAAVVAVLAVPDAIGLAAVSATDRLSASVAIGFVWAAVAAADALARGLATARGPRTAASYAVAMQQVAHERDLRHGFRPIDPPLSVVLTDKRGADEDGWSVVASAVSDGVCEFCCVKGALVEWRRSDDPAVLWTVPDG